MDVMKRSADVNEIAGALARAQKSFAEVVKDTEVAVPLKQGQGYKYKFATLASILNACTEHLNDNDIALTQPTQTAIREVKFLDDHGLQKTDWFCDVMVETTLTHKSGQFMASVFTLPALNTSPQSIGSAISYARRYALQAFLAIAVEDDDGQAAQDGRDPFKQQQRPTQEQRVQGTQSQQPAQRSPEPAPAVQPASVPAAAPDEASEKRRLLAHFEKELAAGHLDAKDDLGTAWKATSGNVSQCIKILEGVVASREETIKQMFEIGLDKGLLNLGDEKRLLEMGHIKASIWLAELEEQAAKKELP
jgi:hypothetical protein